MRDTNTAVFIRGEYKTWSDDEGRHVEPIDPRPRVEITDEGVLLKLFFARADAMQTAELVEVRMEPAGDGLPFEPWHVAQRLPLYLKYARSAMAWELDDADTAIAALREVGSTRRGRNEDLLLRVAEQHEALVSGGERYPIKALAALNHVDKSTASRWVKAARDRGLMSGSSRNRA